MSSPKACRVGFWISEKKAKKLNFGEFEYHCVKEGFELVRLDLSRPLHEQGPFDVILHKVTDVIVEAEQGNAEAQQQVENFKDYTRCHPEVPILDPLDKVHNLLHRGKQYKLVQENDDSKDQLYIIPTFVELNSNNIEENLELLKSSDVTFPIVCKPTVSHGPSWCHEMAIVFHKEGLADVKPPCIAQTFIPHNALLHKVFVLGDKFYIVERPSLKNFHKGRRKTIYFDSHDVSKPDSASFLNELDSSDEDVIPSEVDHGRLIDIAKELQRQLHLTLFGIDVIIDKHSGQYAVIDVNLFPSYDRMQNFFKCLLGLVKHTIAQNSLVSNRNGIDTKELSDKARENYIPSMQERNDKVKNHQSTPYSNQDVFQGTLSVGNNRQTLENINGIKQNKHLDSNKGSSRSLLDVETL